MTEARRDELDAVDPGWCLVWDTEWRRWWGAHHVAVRGMGTKVFRHPLAGDLTLDWDTLVCASDPDQQLVTWTAEPATPSTTDSGCSPPGPPTPISPQHHRRRTPARSSAGW
ncbi:MULTISPECIES: hypothetical protein [unclassified Streptomyces]|uniref:MmyB family transcriptional regulator n=1 Tax=unclassified Streptomyces TaxID=2593676 RepID=UPI002B1D40B8|nr:MULTISPECIES: hypothetical protein [unclassified Streptomyces]